VTGGLKKNYDFTSIQQGKYSVGIVAPGATILIKAHNRKYLSFKRHEYNVIPSLTDQPETVFGVAQITRENYFYLFDAHDLGIIFNGERVQIYHNHYDNTYSIKMKDKFLGVNKEGEFKVYEGGDTNSNNYTRFKINPSRWKLKDEKSFNNKEDYYDNIENKKILENKIENDQNMVFFLFFIF
jgi:hypothetical protein